MATTGGRGPDRLIGAVPRADEGTPGDPDRLSGGDAWRHTFFQAVRLLQLSARESAPVGTGDDPARETLRFSSRVSLAFAPSEVHEVREHDGRTEMVVAFMGIATPASFGSLPMPYSELVLETLRDKNFALRDFFDLFNHRLVSLYYRAWEKCRFPVVYERTACGSHSLFERMLLSVTGLGLPGVQGKLLLDDRALLARAYAVGARGISALALADLIEDYFGVPAVVDQFVPAWYEIENSEQCRLGRQSCHLGEDICLGARARMAQSRFRVRLGPLDWRQMGDFLPRGSAFPALCEMCTLTTGPQFDFEVRLQLASECVPPLRLGVADDAGVPWLGWSTWLRKDGVDTAPCSVTIDGELVAGTGPA